MRGCFLMEMATFLLLYATHIYKHNDDPSCNTNLFEGSCGWVSIRHGNGLQALIAPCSEPDDIQDETEGFLPFLIFHEILFQFFSNCTMIRCSQACGVSIGFTPFFSVSTIISGHSSGGILASYHRRAAFLIPVLDQREEHRGP